MALPLLLLLLLLVTLVTLVTLGWQQQRLCGSPEGLRQSALPVWQ
jgi:hypothetical protein